ncbi:MAG: hypothetical protein HZA91_06675 [Verrucomicrobia bacterium]|nr:hypothetical protein [Verrucomicrobiota bacterium]
MIQSIVLPGRFPTTFYAYPEFTLLNRRIQDKVRFENLNLLFWEYLFSTDFLGFLRKQLGRAASPQIKFLSTVVDSGTIATLRDRKCFYDPERYLSAISCLGGYLAVASNLLRQFSGRNLEGLSVYGLSYDMRRPFGEVLAYARSERSPVMDFYRTRSKLIRKLFATDIVSAVTYSYTDILHLGILCDRYRRPGATVLIHGHSWENNAIDYLIEHSGQYADLLRQIDGIVIAEEGLAETFNQLAETGTTAGIQNLHRFGDGAVSGGGKQSRRRNAVDDLNFARLRQEAERQRPKIFSPELVTLHRLSSRGCYWSRCAFCRHNSRHSGRASDPDEEPENPSQWTASLRQLSKISPVLVFCDQGIDPEAAAALAASARDAGITAKWSLRTRMDPRWDARRIAAVARGGCAELIFGLESINNATLRRMNKTPLTGKAYRSLAEQIHRDAAARGIYNHYCMIYGYPGETYTECRRTLNFLADLIRDVPKTTFSLNRFQLLYKSDVFNSPRTYGMRSVTKAPMLSNMFWYDEPKSQRSIERVENGLAGFYRAIGYREDIVANPILMQTLPGFINDSGHAPLLKAGHRGNPFMA